MEYWEYEIGGGLIDPFHYDVDSILTLVVLLSGRPHLHAPRTYMYLLYALLHSHPHTL